MEIESIKRTIFWVIFFVFMLLLFLFMTSARLPLLFKLILIVLLGILSAMFRMEELFSFLSICLTCVAGVFAGAVLASTLAQFWIFAFVYVLAFFATSEVFEKKMFEI